MRKLVLAAPFVLLAFPPAAPAVAQDIEPFVVFSVSDQPMLRQSFGGGIGISFPVLDWLRLGGGLMQTQGTTVRDGRICEISAGELKWCREDRIREQITVRSMRVNAMPTLPLAAGFRASGVVGLSFNELSNDGRGETEEGVSDMYVPPSAQIGGYLRLDLEWRPSYDSPLGIWVGGASHWLNVDGCRTSAMYYTPFCGVDRYTEIVGGIRFRIGY